MKKLLETFTIITEDYNCSISAVFVDTLSRASIGLDENSSTEMGMFLASFEKIKYIFKCAILFIHHSGKSSNKGLRGSSAILATIETCIKVNRKSDKYIILEVEKQKDGRELSLRFELISAYDSLIICATGK